MSTPAKFDRTQYLTSGEAATRLGVSTRSVQIWANDGVLESICTPGGHRRIPVAALASFLERAQVSGQRGAPLPASPYNSEMPLPVINLGAIRYSAWIAPGGCIVHALTYGVMGGEVQDRGVPATAPVFMGEGEQRKRVGTLVQVYPGHTTPLFPDTTKVYYVAELPGSELLNRFGN